MTAVEASPTVGTAVAGLAGAFVRWLESGERQPGLFADDVFCDLSLPHWRIQAEGVEAVVGIREGEHPYRGAVRVEALDSTSRGFLIQLEERWEAEGQQWYCRELIHCVVTDDRISELVVSCTGDWDAQRQRLHAEQVRLLRP